MKMEDNSFEEFKKEIRGCNIAQLLEIYNKERSVLQENVTELINTLADPDGENPELDEILDEGNKKLDLLMPNIWPVLLYRGVTGWGCDYSPHRRAFVRLPLQEIREHVMSK